MELKINAKEFKEFLEKNRVILLNVEFTHPATYEIDCLESGFYLRFNNGFRQEIRNIETSGDKVKITFADHQSKILTLYRTESIFEFIKENSKNKRS